MKKEKGGYLKAEEDLKIKIKMKLKNIWRTIGQEFSKHE